MTDHFVYVIRDEHASPLYIGCSASVGSRLAQHCLREWFTAAVSVTWDRFPTQESASREERRLIELHKPPANLQFTGRHGDLGGWITRRRHEAGLPCMRMACPGNRQRSELDVASEAAFRLAGLSDARRAVVGHLLPALYEEIGLVLA